MNEARTKNSLFNLWWNCVTIYLKCFTLLDRLAFVNGCRLYNDIIIMFRQLTGFKTFKGFFSLPEMEIVCLVTDICHPNSTITSSSLTSLPPKHVYSRQMRAFILHSHEPESARLDFTFLYIPAPTPQLKRAFQSLKHLSC